MNKKGEVYIYPIKKHALDLATLKAEPHEKTEVTIKRAEEYFRFLMEGIQGW